MRQAGALGAKFKEVLTFRAQQVLTLHLHGPENGASLNIASWVPACLPLLLAGLGYSLLPSPHLSDLDSAAREERFALKRES